MANQLDATRVEGSNIRAKDEFHLGNDTHNQIKMYHYGYVAKSQAEFKKKYYDNL